MRSIKINRNGWIAITVVIPALLLVNLLFFGGESKIAGTIDPDDSVKNYRLGECVNCHTTGQSPVMAKDTINLSSCYICHREDIGFLVPVSKQVHIYHSGNISTLPPSDYSSRHKDIIERCESCHINSGSASAYCTRCHSGDHVSSKNDIACGSCHGQLNDLFSHPSIKVSTHDIFGNESCVMCHSSDKVGLQMASGLKVPITQASRLCRQCHSGIYKEWSAGEHISTVECTVCHDPHSPKSITISAPGVENGRKKKTEPKAESTPLILKRPEYEKN